MTAVIIMIVLCFIIASWFVGVIIDQIKHL